MGLFSSWLAKYESRVNTYLEWLGVHWASECDTLDGVSEGRSVSLGFFS